MKPKIGIVGSKGMVGGALKRYFEKKDCRLYCYDKAGEGSMDLVNQADFIYIAVPTPYVEGLGCDTRIIEDVLSNLRAGKVIVIKSTVIPGTTDRLQKKFPGQKFIFNPEFLTEATADQDINFPDSQIVGFTKQSRSKAEEVLKQLPAAPYRAIIPVFIAEFVKYAVNTWFAVKVAKNNELYDMFTKFGGSDKDFQKLASCLSVNKMVGGSHLEIWHKGYRGYGGKCLPKDTKAFLYFADKLKVKTPIMSATDQYNNKLVRQKVKPEL